MHRRRKVAGLRRGTEQTLARVRALKVRRWWWHKFALFEPTRGADRAATLGEDAAAAALSCGDAESERGLECSVRRGCRMVVSEEYGADRRCMAGRLKGGLWPGPGDPDSEGAGSRRAAEGTARGGQTAQRGRQTDGSSSSQRRNWELGRGETTGSGHGVGEPKAAAGEGGQRRAAARIVSLGGAKLEQGAGESDAGRESQHSRGAAAERNREAKATGGLGLARAVARCSCCVRACVGLRCRRRVRQRGGETGWPDVNQIGGEEGLFSATRYYGKKHCRGMLGPR